jgi:hypothetical protein
LLGLSFFQRVHVADVERVLVLVKNTSSFCDKGLAFPSKINTCIVIYVAGLIMVGFI